MRNDRGFTLIEMLFVLGVTSMILFLGFSVQAHVLEEHQTRQFFKTFRSDVLLMQQRTMVNQENMQMTIKPEQHLYEIRNSGMGKLIVARKIPDEWKIELRTLKQPMSFSFNGTIRHPGTLFIKTKTKSYKMIFPLGKGREYIVEQ